MSENTYNDASGSTVSNVRPSSSVEGDEDALTKEALELLRSTSEKLEEAVISRVSRSGKTGNNRERDSANAKGKERADWIGSSGKQSDLFAGPEDSLVPRTGSTDSVRRDGSLVEEFEHMMGGLALLESLPSELAAVSKNTKNSDESVVAQHKAAALTPDSYPDSLVSLSSLGDAVEVDSEPGDLEEVMIESLRRAMSPIPDDYLGKSLLFDRLGELLETRFRYSDELSDLKEAIVLMRRAVNVTPDDNPDKAMRLNNLGTTLETCFDRLGKIDDLEEAIMSMRHATNLIPDDHPDKSMYLNNLGNALETRFDHLGELNDLEEAIVSKRRAVALTSDDDSHKLACFNNLGTALKTRFHRLKESNDLELAIEYFRRAVDLASDDHPNKPGCLSNLAATLEARFHLVGELDDMEEAIMLKRHAVDLTADDHPDKPERLNSLGKVLGMRFYRFGELKDLEEATLSMRRAVDHTPDDDPAKLEYVSNVGITLETRFHRLGELNDLELAISSFRCAVNLTPNDHLAKPQRLNSLGKALGMRFHRLGELNDLEESVVSLRCAVDLTSDNGPAKLVYTSNVGTALETRFHRLGELNDLELAIVSFRCAVDFTPDDHPSKPEHLHNLGRALGARFHRLGELNDLEEYIMSMRYALDLIPDGHPAKPGYIISLGTALETRFHHLGEIDDLEVAIVSFRHAASLIPDSHPDCPGYLIMLARALLSHRGMLMHDDLNECLVRLVSAVDQQPGPPSTRFRAVKHASNLGWDAIRAQVPNVGLDFLVNVYERAFKLVPQVIWCGDSVGRHHENLTEIGQLVNGAVAASIAVGDHARAVEWLDLGRSAVCGQLLQLYSPMDDLRAHESAHGSNSVEDLPRSVLSQLEVAGRDNGVSVEDLTLNRASLEQEYSSLLAHVSALNGFENFLLPKRYAELVHASKDGPVVIINVHDSRCDALVVSHSESQNHPLHIPLPALSLELANNMHSQFNKSLQQASLRERVDVRASSRGSSSDSLRGVEPLRSAENSDLAEVLTCLWSSTIYPIVQALEGELHELTVDLLPHVTWCATGPLAFLPIHAAGDYESMGQGGLKLSDIVVSSYTTTLSALLRSSLKHLPSLSSLSTKILVVSQPETPGFSPLPSVSEEVARLRHHFQGDAVVQLDRAKATVDAVQRAMSRHSQLIHLACHGIQDIQNPRESGFALQDGKLYLSKIVSQSNDSAALAFLSTCQTITGGSGAKFPNEITHLVAGMQSAGYRSVIGTMWSIEDCDAPLIADEFYRHLQEDESTMRGRSRVAYALHDAVKVLRDEAGELDFVRWAPFVHFGV